MDQQTYEARPERGEIWNQRTSSDAGPRRVLIVHAEPDVGDCFALMLAMRGFEAVQIGDAQSALQFAHDWRPQVLFVDTRIGCDHDPHDYAFAHALRCDGADDIPTQMLIAFAAGQTSDPRDAMLDAGYDGFFRMPCPVWRLFDVLTRFYVH